MEHHDRLARFGVEHVQAVSAACGRRLVVPEAEAAGDLVGDVSTVAASVGARLYGQRAAKRRAARAVAVAAGGAAR